MTTDKTPRYDDGPVYDGGEVYPPESAAPDRHGEAMQRHINKNSKHSERARHGGNPGAGEKIR